MQSSSRVLDDMVWCTLRAPVESPLPTISAALALLRDMKRSSFLGCSVSGSRSAVGRAPGRVSAHHGSPTSASPSSNIMSYSSGIITQSTGTKALEGGGRLDLGEPRKEGNKELVQRFLRGEEHAPRQQCRQSHFCERCERRGQTVS